MAITQANIDAHELSLANGVKSVQVDGKRIEYRTVDELIAALTYMKRSLAEKSGEAVTGPSIAVQGR